MKNKQAIDSKHLNGNQLMYANLNQLNTRLILLNKIYRYGVLQLTATSHSLTAFPDDDDDGGAGELIRQDVARLRRIVVVHHREPARPVAHVSARVRAVWRAVLAFEQLGLGDASYRPLHIAPVRVCKKRSLMR